MSLARMKYVRKRIHCSNYSAEGKILSGITDKFIAAETYLYISGNHVLTADT